MGEYMVCPGCRRYFRKAEPGDILKSMLVYGCVPTVKEVSNVKNIPPESEEFYLSVDLCQTCEKQQPGAIKFFQAMGERELPHV
jgi:hypothetical protein